MGLSTGSRQPLFFLACYNLIMNDTDPATAQKHAELLRAAGPLRRATMAWALTNHVIDSCKRAIAEQYPEMTETQRKVKFVEVTYGPELAKKVRRFFDERGEL